MHFAWFGIPALLTGAESNPITNFLVNLTVGSTKDTPREDALDINTRINIKNRTGESTQQLKSIPYVFMVFNPSFVKGGKNLVGIWKGGR